MAYWGLEKVVGTKMDWIGLDTTMRREHRCVFNVSHVR